MISIGRGEQEARSSQTHGDLIPSHEESRRSGFPYGENLNSSPFAGKVNGLSFLPRFDVNLRDPKHFQSGFPHELFKTLRHEAPIFWHSFPPGMKETQEEGFWVLTKHADIQAVNRDHERFCAIDGPSLAYTPAMRGQMLVTMDGAAHVRQRKLISAGFTPRMIGQLEEQAREWAISIIDRALERGRCEFVQDVAYPLPMNMIADIVGIPLEDRDWLFALTNDFIQGGDPGRNLTPEQKAMTQVKMFQYGQDLGRRKRENPQDDIWTLLSTLEMESDEGERSSLSQTELDFFFMLLILAGSETTRNAIALGFLALLEHPDQLEQLRRDPTLMRSAVEEILRWSSPVAYFARRATCDVEIRGVRIAKGQRVTLWYPSGNRDEEAFEDPFRFDIGRWPNPHQAFGGGGVHFCLGASLARREITILFEELLARTREVELLAPPRYSVLGIWNPVTVIPSEIQVRIT